MAAPTFFRCAAWLVFALCAMAAITAARAEEGEPAEPGTEPVGETPQCGHRVREQLLDRPHTILSRSVETLSRNQDAVLGDPNRLYDSTGSTAQLRAHITDFEGGHSEGRVEVNAQLSLPNTQDRLKIMVERGLQSWTETGAERDIQNVTGAAPDGLTDNNFYAGPAVRRIDAATFLSADQRPPSCCIPDAADRGAVRGPPSSNTLKRGLHRDGFMPVPGGDAVCARPGGISCNCGLPQPEFNCARPVASRGVRDNDAGRASV